MKFKAEHDGFYYYFFADSISSAYKKAVERFYSSLHFEYENKETNNDLELNIDIKLTILKRFPAYCHPQYFSKCMKRMTEMKPDGLYLRLR